MLTHNLPCNQSGEYSNLCTFFMVVIPTDQKGLPLHLLDLQRMYIQEHVEIHLHNHLSNHLLWTPDDGPG